MSLSEKETQKVYLKKSSEWVIAFLLWFMAKSVKVGCVHSVRVFELQAGIWKRQECCNVSVFVSLSLPGRQLQEGRDRAQPSSVPPRAGVRYGWLNQIMQSWVFKFHSSISFALLKALFCLLLGIEGKQGKRKEDHSSSPLHPHIPKWSKETITGAYPNLIPPNDFVCLCHLPGCSSCQESLLRHLQRGFTVFNTINQGLSEPLHHE